MDKQHLHRQFDNDLNDIRSRLLEMGGKVEIMLIDALNALLARDSSLAEQVILYDHEINRMEIEIDEKCLEVLAMRQPAARDLRFITLAMKIVTDLERIGDQCRNIGKRTKELNEEPPLKPYIDIPRMAHWAGLMVKQALDAFVEGNVELALKVCRDDSFIDELFEQVQRELLTFMIEDPKTISRSMNISYIAKCLERIADHATNISEMVVFMVNGKDIRHTTVD